MSLPVNRFSRVAVALEAVAGEAHCERLAQRDVDRALALQRAVVAGLELDIAFELLRAAWRAMTLTAPPVALRP